MKSLKLWISIWSICAAALLLTILLPKGDEKPALPVVYAEFLPGASLDSVSQNDSCHRDQYQEEYSVEGDGVVFICSVSSSDPYVRTIYVSSKGTTVQSSYFYLKPRSVMLADLVAWFDRWDKQRGKGSRVYILFWKHFSAYVGKGWPGLDTEVISISFRD